MKTCALCETAAADAAEACPACGEGTWAESKAPVVVSPPEAPAEIPATPAETPRSKRSR